MSEMAGFCWPLSAAPGGAIDFYSTTTAPTYERSYVRFANRPGVTDDVIARGEEII
jgi:hypothetical protein